MARNTAKKTAAKKTAGDQLGTKVTEGDEQHPALVGSDAEEVAARSQDVTDSTESADHVKDFVVLKATWEGTVEHEPQHLANIEATRQAMIGQGLRPTADGEFVGATDHPDGVSLVLTYKVPATAAIVAGEDEPLVAHAHVTLEDQHAAEESGDE